MRVSSRSFVNNAMSSTQLSLSFSLSLSLQHLCLWRSTRCPLLVSEASQSTQTNRTELSKCDAGCIYSYAMLALNISSGIVPQRTEHLPLALDFLYYDRLGSGVEELSDCEGACIPEQPHRFRRASFCVMAALAFIPAHIWFVAGMWAMLQRSNPFSLLSAVMLGCVGC